MQIPLHYTPRDYQQKGLEALDNGAKFAVWCWARRGGKDLTAFCYGIKKAVASPMNVVIVWPTKKQGYDNFWTAVDNDGIPILDRIPEGLIAKKSSTKDEMSITLINGSTIMLLGAKDKEAAEKLRGANGKLYILSEFVDLPPGILGVIRPVVRVNGGQIIVQSTPKIDGVSGATFHKLYKRALKHKNQYASLITAREYLTEEELEEVRQEYIDEYGNDFLFRQEFLCDWGQTSQTSYYGEVLQALENAKKVGLFPYDKNYPVYTAWDLGMSDMTSVVFFQYFTVDDMPQVRVVDYYESNNLKYTAHIQFVLSKPYNIQWHFFPHDATVRDSDNIERIEKIREAGLTNSSVLKREPKEDGIGRVATMLGSSVFHAPMTKNELIRKLKLYKRKFNGDTGDYLGPEHKTESHAADATRYMYQAIELEFNKRTCELLYSQGSSSQFYGESESDLIETTMYIPSE